MTCTLITLVMTNLIKHILRTSGTNAKENIQDLMTMNESNKHVPTISVLVHASVRPKTTLNIQDCFDTNKPLRSFWIQTVYEQFDKNASYRVFTRPIKKSTVPNDTMILRSVLTPTVKPTYGYSSSMEA